MVRNTFLITLVGLACAFAAGCGGDAARGPTQAEPERPNAKPQPAEVDLERFLLQADEEPGFQPVESPRVQSGADSLGLPAADAERLRRTGFVSITFQPIEGDGRTGVTNVHLFESEVGARDWMGHETSDEAIERRIPGVRIRRFAVAGVPGARGWTGRDPHGHRIGHVLWVQGRCVLVLGNEGDGPLVKPLSIGAKAIYQRTKGACPA